MSDRWRFVAALDEVGAEGKVFAYRDGPSDESGILVRVGEGVVAWKNVCRHLAVRLDRDRPGEVVDREGRLLCQQHGAVFRAEDGLCLAGPCAGSHLRSLPVQLVDGRVLLDTSALGTFVVSRPRPPDA